jgi:hypothetical protein
VDNLRIKFLYIFMSILMLGLLITGVASCNSNTSESMTETEDNTVVLTVSKGDQTSTYTMSALKDLPSISGTTGRMSSTGTIEGPYQYQGVALTELLKAVGGITEENAVRISAKDGYTMTMSYRQITEGNFTILDVTTGKEVEAISQPVVFIAYAEGGQPLTDLGPLRLGIMTADNQLTEGHWWVKWAQKIEVINVEKPWTLNLEGIVTEAIDPASFESCSAIGCHGAKWTDDQNRVWEGTPLWYFVGKVDDTNTHEGDAFDVAAAEKGYEVQLIAADGFNLKLTSQEVAKNNDLIIAYRRDGNPLPENQWPLRLVGATLQKSQMIGQITDIKLVFPSEETTSPPATEESSVLTVIKGSETKTYTLSTLKALTPLSGYAGKKNKAGVITGPLAYKGVALTILLSDMGGLPSGASVKFTAKDGYTKTLTYDQITQGTFTTYDTSGNTVNPDRTPTVFIAYEIEGQALDEDTGPLQLAIMTCQGQVTDGSNFVNQLENIEVISP